MRKKVGRKARKVGSFVVHNCLTVFWTSSEMNHDGKSVSDIILQYATWSAQENGKVWFVIWLLCIAILSLLELWHDDDSWKSK
jgi:hypothetical protein